MDTDPVLQVSSVRKRYGDREVLRGVSFCVARGERVALMGPSGSGKTTLLNCIGGVDRADEGSILLLGRELAGLDGDSLAALRRRDVGTVFQFFHLLPTLTAAENVEFPLQLLGVSRSERSERVRSALERVGVAHRSGALPSEMSGGECQRVAIARSLVHRPALLLADEPTGNLDSANGENVLGLLKALSEEHRCALVVVTHSDEVAAICHRTLQVRDGLLAENAS